MHYTELERLAADLEHLERQAGTYGASDVAKLASQLDTVRSVVRQLAQVLETGGDTRSAALFTNYNEQLQRLQLDLRAYSSYLSQIKKPGLF